MRYKILHKTEYTYSDRVSHCYNLAFMSPRTTARQRCIRSKVSISPSVASTSKNIDYFGNTAYHFEILRPHKNLIIKCESEVETQQQKHVGDLNESITCSQVSEFLSACPDEDTLLSREYLLDSSMINVFAALKTYAQPSFSEDKPFLSCVMDLTQRIFEEFTYSPEATTIATPLSDVLNNRKGVCQDFAHLQIACLRALGFPAKYVSGYIETLPAPGQEKLVGSDATHAWISVFLPTVGWVEFDPTNNCLAAEQHIITAMGRDYYDVTPLRGVIFGGGNNPILSVSVDVARV